jgi:hypothetical protein
MSDRVSVLMRERFNVLNHITWHKQEYTHAAIYGEEGIRMTLLMAYSSLSA